MLCRATLGRQQGAGWLVTTARQRLDVVLSGDPNFRQLEPHRQVSARTRTSATSRLSVGASTRARRLELFISERLRRVELRRPTCGQIRGSQRESDQTGNG